MDLQIGGSSGPPTRSSGESGRGGAEGEKLEGDDSGLGNGPTQLKGYEAVTALALPLSSTHFAEITTLDRAGFRWRRTILQGGAADSCKTTGEGEEEGYEEEYGQ
jgi:hypothetical protein